MTRRTIAGALVALGLVAASLAPAEAQQSQGTIVVPAPAPSASPGTTVVAPAPGGTTVVVPPGSTVTVTPPAATAAVAVRPWCAGAYAPTQGTNFGGCPGFIAR
jgi:hypothetical protein